MPAPLSFGPTDGWLGVDNLVKFISIVCLQLGPSNNVELSCYKTRWQHALGPFLGSAMHVFSFKCFVVNEVAADWYPLVMSYGHDDTSGHTISKQAYTAEHPSFSWVPKQNISSHESSCCEEIHAREAWSGGSVQIKIPATIIKQPIHGLHVKGFTQVENSSK